MIRQIPSAVCMALLASASIATEPPSGNKPDETGSPAHWQSVLKESKDSISRRTAFVCLLDNEKTSNRTILEGLDDADPVIRKRALYEYFIRNGDKAYPEMLKRVEDPDPQVMRMMLDCAVRFSDKAKTAELLKNIGKKSAIAEVKRKANQLATFTFHKETVRLKDNPTYDHEVTTVKSIPLPEEGWKFMTDPAQDGHSRGFFQTSFDDAKWKTVRIGAWEKQGFPGYDGIAWYRIEFTMPPKIDCNVVELHFRGVDESGWVWLNGQYVGQHDIGPGGWDKPFWLDVTKEIKWNAGNQLTVRVEDTMHAGGIWKPVSVEILK